MGSASNEKMGSLLAGLPARFTAKVCEIASRTKKLGQDDPRRITHSLKVGFAITLVSLFYYYQPLYDSFGASAMWAVMTVIVVFEFSVGTYLYLFKVFILKTEPSGISLYIYIFISIYFMNIYTDIQVNFNFRSYTWKRFK